MVSLYRFQAHLWDNSQQAFHALSIYHQFMGLGQYDLSAEWHSINNTIDIGTQMPISKWLSSRSELSITIVCMFCFLFFTISIWLILILEREDKQTIGKWNIIVIDAGMNALSQ